MEVYGKRLLTLETVCEPCQTENLSKQSDGFCNNCKEYMCQTCFLHHLKAKSCRNHVLEPCNTGSFDSKLQIKEAKCKKHVKETIKYYCSSHYAVMCGDCFVSDHPKCEPKFIRDVANNFVESSEFKSLRSKIQKLDADKEESKVRILQNRQENKALLDHAFQKLRATRVETNVWLDKMEKSIETEARKMSADNEVLLSEMGKKLRSVSDDIDEIKEKTDTHVFQQQNVFINMVECKPKIRVIETTLSDIRINNVIREYTFVPGISISSLRLGVIKMYTNNEKTQAGSQNDSSVTNLNMSSDTGEENFKKVETPCNSVKPTVLFSEIEVPRNSVTLTKKIGCDTFGEIYAGKCRIKGKTVDVAVNTMREGIEFTAVDFLAEAKIMRQLSHSKIIKLIAVNSTKLKPIWVITELMVKGNLLEYLRNDEGKQLQFLELIYMAEQIADGMAYLGSMNYVHTNLRAESILVAYNKEVKVARLGAAHLIEGEFCELKADTKFSIKWTAPEVIADRKFSTKSDVWSFGVLLYELITYGQVPYQGMISYEVSTRVAEGYRMPKPSNCPYPYYDIMLDCWKKGAAHRPTFEFLKCFLGDYEEGVIGCNKFFEPHED